MNALGRDVLRKAALDGVKQCKEAYADGDARCALGVLAEAIGCRFESTRGRITTIFTHVDWTSPYGLSWKTVQCPYCPEQRDGERTFIAHLNDEHDMDFLGIAEKLYTPNPEDA